MPLVKLEFNEKLDKTHFCVKGWDDFIGQEFYGECYFNHKNDLDISRLVFSNNLKISKASKIELIRLLKDKQ